MEIHIDRGGQRYGPYSLEDARRYLSEGTLLASDLAWHDGMSDWLPLGQIGGIGNSGGAPAPPPPRSHGAAVSPGVRPLEARAEESQKGTLVLVLGILLIVSAILPVYYPMAGSMSGMPGAPSSIQFPTFKFTGRSAGDVFESLLPLIVGITLCSIAHTTRAIARSIVILSLGAVGLITMLANSSSGGRGSAGMGGMGMGLSLSHVSERDVIFVLGWTCLLIGAGIVFYRPGKLLGFILGCVGGGLACLSWLIPEQGSSIPIIEVFKTFRHSVVIALGMLCWMGMTIASSVLCFVNLPRKPARVLHSTSRLAACLMVGGLLVFGLFLTLTPLLMSSPGFKMEVGDRFKAMFSMLTFILTAGVAMLGKILLVPLGVVDLLVGRADR